MRIEGQVRHCILPCAFTVSMAKTLPFCRVVPHCLGGQDTDLCRCAHQVTPPTANVTIRPAITHGRTSATDNSTSVPGAEYKPHDPPVPEPKRWHVGRKGRVASSLQCPNQRDDMQAEQTGLHHVSSVPHIRYNSTTPVPNWTWDPCFTLALQVNNRRRTKTLSHTFPLSVSSPLPSGCSCLHSHPPSSSTLPRVQV